MVIALKSLKIDCLRLIKNEIHCKHDIYLKHFYMKKYQTYSSRPQQDSKLSDFFFIRNCFLHISFIFQFSQRLKKKHSHRLPISKPLLCFFLDLSDHQLGKRSRAVIHELVDSLRAFRQTV